MSQNIKALRYSVDLSCSKAAKLFECSLSTWKRWEREGRMPVPKYQDLKLYAGLYKAMLVQFDKSRSA